MGIQSLSLATGATVSATGGTAFTLTPDGVSVPNGVHVVKASETDFRIRPNATFKVKQPTVDSLGVYTKDKKSVLYVQPKILASGQTVFNLVRIEVEIHPETSASDAADLRKIGSQLLFDADTDAFWISGSIA